MHDVIRSQKVGQGATNNLVGKGLVQRRNFLKDMVLQIALCLKYSFGLAVDFLVDIG